MIRGRAVAAAVAVALLCLGTVAAQPATAGLPAVGNCVADAELKIGDAGPSVICLQFALGMMHMSTQPLTGVFDQTTADAISWFQAGHPPLRVDGRAGAQTLAALGIWSGKTIGAVASAPAVTPCRADATIRPGDTGVSVICLQDTLRELGLYDQSVDSGVSDFATVAALQQYQRETPPLQVDGWAGPRTLAAMGIWSGNADGTTTILPSTPGTAPSGPWPAGVQNEVNWELTPGGIPYYGNHKPCSLADANMIAFQFAKDGADIATEQWAVYIASREGSCNYAAVNYNLATQDDSHCTFQLNALAGMFAPGGSLGRLGWTADSVTQSMENCANAASDLWVYCGRGPWTPPYSCRPPWKDIAAGTTTIITVPPSVASPVTIPPATTPATVPATTVPVTATPAADPSTTTTTAAPPLQTTSPAIADSATTTTTVAG
ncbi:MAG: hypothetical protein JWM34_4878 [Ilumatobacteraceae bacterium]|nr:hypothetical protein [Ilumatobacteraceae bacterium]